ncbi:MAG: diaminopimelate epimerase [Bacteriovoracaceae bacterium]|nr:diaminopimelate epimerase [Bacteriovoracaceae bacterium]
MNINFFKYCATGNDFIIIDNRQEFYQAGNHLLWEKMCAKHTGIGADGVLLLESSKQADFRMRIMNADGLEVSMCGNGLRALALMAYQDLKIKKVLDYKIETKNGFYPVTMQENLISVEMTEFYDKDKISLIDFAKGLHHLYLNTGVPHCVLEVKNLKNFNVLSEAKKIRHDARFAQGTNVNFFEVISQEKQVVAVRTFERGVEDEVLSCGTGMTAVALACAHFFNWKKQITVQTAGGQVHIKFTDDYKKIFLVGPAFKVFAGDYLFAETPNLER